MKWYRMVNQAGNAPAHIYIFDVIVDYAWDDDEVTAKGFIDDLEALGDVAEIVVHINSPGGSVYAGNVIYNVLKRHAAKITVMIDGLAASIASVVAMAGDEVIMPANAMLMIHDPWSYAGGNAADLRKAADMLDTAKESILTSYRAKTELNDEKLTTMMSDETWMTAQEAVDLGFADTIEEPVQLAASYDLTRYKKVPENLSKLTIENKVTTGQPSADATNQPEQQGATTMNLDQLEAKHPELVAQIRNGAVTDATAAIQAQAVADENKRRESVRAQLMPGHEDLIASLENDGKTTGPEAAIQVLAAEKVLVEARTNSMRTDAEDIKVPHAEPGDEAAETAAEDATVAVMANAMKRK